MIEKNKIQDNQKKLEKKRIITEDGLFYTNYSDRFKLASATVEGTEYYSEYLVWLREKYGIKVGKPQPYANGEMSEDSNACGVYIVDYQRYLADTKEKIIIKDEDLELQQHEELETKESTHRFK